MVDHVANRERVISEIRRELVGPAPSGDPIEIQPVLRFSSWDAYEGPYVQAENGEEILIQDSPSTRYGVGVLYPQRAQKPEEAAVLESPAAMVGPELLADVSPSELGNWAEDKPKERPSSRQGDNEDELDLSSANSLKPSTMAVSFRARVPDGATLEVTATGGRYESQTVEVSINSRRSKREWWLRKPVEFVACIGAAELKTPKPKMTRVSPADSHSVRIEDMDR